MNLNQGHSISTEQLGIQVLNGQISMQKKIASENKLILNKKSQVNNIALVWEEKWGSSDLTLLM